MNLIESYGVAFDAIDQTAPAIGMGYGDTHLASLHTSLINAGHWWYN